MAFPTKDTFTFDFEAQSDYPNWTPAQTKEYMNARGEELRVALNAVANLLNATTSDASGADNTGIPETIVGSGTNVRDRADWLYAQIVAAVLGAIPDGSLATIKYADGSVTAAKCAADVATQAELGVVSDTVDTHLMVDKTSAHLPLNVGLGNVTNDAQIAKSLLTTQGDIIYATGANTPARLAKGTALQKMRMNAGATAPEWFTDTPGTQIANGTWADTATNINGSATYTKTIALGFNATKGRIILRGLSGAGAIVHFRIDTNEALGMANISGGNSNVVVMSYPIDGGLTSKIFSSVSAVKIEQAYISGTNLVLIFKNDTASSDTLKVYKSIWEVEG